MTITATGPGGEVRWMYLPAITFGRWSFTGTKSAGTLTAQIITRDEFRAVQQPLVIVVPAGRAEWRWTVMDLQINGEMLTASVSRL